MLEGLTTLVLPPDLPIVAEGFGLTPGLVAGAADEPPLYICVLPTDDFKQASMERRGKGQFGGLIDDQRAAKAKLLERDRILTRRLAEEAADVGAEILEVDGTVSSERLMEILSIRLGF